MRKRDIQADILAILSDGKVWSIRRIAEEVEVHYNTVYNHVRDLSYRFNIRIFRGGVNKGGVQLIKEKSICIENIESEELYVIYLNLEAIEEKSEGIILFISRLKKSIDMNEIRRIEVCS